MRDIDDNAVNSAMKDKASKVDRGDTGEGMPSRWRPRVRPCRVCAGPSVTKVCRTCAAAGRTWPQRACEHCDSSFYPDKAGRRYCSLSCLYDARKNRETTTCPVCKNDFEVTRDRRLYCSVPCAGKARRVTKTPGFFDNA